MGNRRIEMHEYRQIIRRLRSGQSERSIAGDGLASRTKIKEIREIAKKHGWLDPTNQLPSDKELKAIIHNNQAHTREWSSVTPYCVEVKKWFEEGIQASVIYEYLVKNHGFSGAYNCVQRFVKKLKNENNTKLTVLLSFQPGEAAQVDFGKGPKLHDDRVGHEVETWFFIMTLCWSRHQYVELVTHQDIETWLNCHQNAFNWFGGVVNKVIIDNPKCAIAKACYYNPQVQRSFEEFAQDYGFIISACPPRDPKKKGRVESGVKYVKKNFLPLKLFKSLQDANRQLKEWVMGTAGNRTHGSTFEKPLARFTEIEKTLLKPLPLTSLEIGVWQKVTLYKDCHIRYLKCIYSAPHQLYGKMLWLKATQTCLAIYHDHELVAFHPRLFKPGQRSTKQEHLPANARFYFKRNQKWCLEQSEQIGKSCQYVIESLLTDPVRDLLRQAQSIINLAEQFGKTRLELACKRAITFNTVNYQTIKTILKQGLDYEKVIQDRFESFGSVYRGQGIFQRNFNDFIH
jgi:transposase